jgi:hypothetical protein
MAEARELAPTSKNSNELLPTSASEEQKSKRVAIRALIIIPV